MRDTWELRISQWREFLAGETDFADGPFRTYPESRMVVDDRLSPGMYVKVGGYVFCHHTCVSAASRRGTLTFDGDGDVDVAFVPTGDPANHAGELEQLAAEVDAIFDAKVRGEDVDTADVSERLEQLGGRILLQRRQAQMLLAG